MEQIVDNAALIVPSLDVPVPADGEPTVGGMPTARYSYSRAGYTKCPRSPLSVSLTGACVRFAEQMAEQLVEVLTIISYSSLRGIVEQNMDIPVPRGRGRVGLGFHPGQSLTAYSGADFPAADCRAGTLTFQFLVCGRDLLSAVSSSGLPGTANQGVFRDFSF